MKKLEAEIAKIYKQSEPKIRKMYTDYFKQFEAEDAKMQELLEAGGITQREYKAWRMRTMTTGKKWDEFCRRVANALLEIDKQAVELSNRAMDKVFIDEYNEAGKDIARRVNEL